MKRIELATHSVDKNATIDCYRIAQTLLVSDLQATALEPFATDERGEWKDRIADGDGRPQESDGTITYSGPGWVGNRWRNVVCMRTSNGYEITVDGIGAFSVASSDQRIKQIERSDSCTSAMLIEAALGPPLILALALQGKFCLHAGAARIGKNLVAFVGESGYGKSTLARYLGSESGPGWQRICDDILPLMLGQDTLLALPRFPQLKLPTDQQPSLHVPEALPFHTVYELDKNAPRDENDVELHPMTRTEMVVTMLQHTVATRLFDQELLARHFIFCAEATGSIRVRRLSYPRSFEMLPAVREAILGDLNDHC